MTTVMTAPYWYHTPEDALPLEGQWSVRIDWCQANCKGAWKYKLQGKFVFYNKEDYAMFLLKWA